MTAADLLALWAERDRRYRLRRMMHAPWPLVRAEAQLVREHRQREIGLIPTAEETEALRQFFAGRILGQP